MKPAFVLNDGGRQAAGYKGLANDCVARAIAIADGMAYQAAYDLVTQANKTDGNGKTARNGVKKDTTKKLLTSLGWVWTQAPKLEGRKARCSDLPPGTFIAKQAKHLVAVVDGVPQDTWDCSVKMVYGYWKKSA